MLTVLHYYLIDFTVSTKSTKSSVSHKLLKIKFWKKNQTTKVIMYKYLYKVLLKAIGE